MSDSDMRGQAVGLFPDVAIAHPGYACLLFLILALGPQRTWALKELGPSKNLGPQRTWALKELGPSKKEAAN
jgi:hypothetical protein